MVFPQSRSLALLLVVGAALLGGCSATAASKSTGASGSTDPSRNVVGVTQYAANDRPLLPEIAGTTLDGKSLALSSLKGDVVVLNAWASYCEPCRTESPALGRIAKATQGKGVRFVGLNVQDRSDAARSFAAAAGTTYPHLVDKEGSLIAKLRIVPPSAIPSTLVLDRSGKVAARVIGPINPATFESVVRAVAAEKLVPTP